MENSRGVKFLKNRIKSRISEVSDQMGEYRYSLYINIIDQCDDLDQLKEMSDIDLQIGLLRYIKYEIDPLLSELNLTLADIQNGDNTYTKLDNHTENFELELSEIEEVMDDPEVSAVMAMLLASRLGVEPDDISYDSDNYDESDSGDLGFSDSDSGDSDNYDESDFGDLGFDESDSGESDFGDSDSGDSDFGDLGFDESEDSDNYDESDFGDLGFDDSDSGDSEDSDNYDESDFGDLGFDESEDSDNYDESDFGDLFDDSEDSDNIDYTDDDYDNSDLFDDTDETDDTDYSDEDNHVESDLFDDSEDSDNIDYTDDDYDNSDLFEDNIDSLSEGNDEDYDNSDLFEDESNYSSDLFNDLDDAEFEDNYDDLGDLGDLGEIEDSDDLGEIEDSDDLGEIEDSDDLGEIEDSDDLGEIEDSDEDDYDDLGDLVDSDDGFMDGYEDPGVSNDSSEILDMADYDFGDMAADSDEDIDSGFIDDSDELFNKPAPKSNLPAKPNQTSIKRKSPDKIFINGTNQGKKTQSAFNKFISIDRALSKMGSKATKIIGNAKNRIANSRDFDLSSYSDSEIDF